MPIQATRALLHAALSGELDDVEYRIDETFGFEVPVVRARGRPVASGSSFDLGRPGRVRRQGARARGDVPEELRAVSMPATRSFRGRGLRARRAVDALWDPVASDAWTRRTTYS